MKRLWLIAIPLILIVGGAFLILNMLQPALPNPTGQHIVGYQRTNLEQGDRWVDVQIFYPATEKTDKQPKAMPQMLAAQMAKSFGMPEAAMQDDRPLPAYIGAKAVSGPHPVLIFNHGHGMYAGQNSHQVIELASNGYVVMAISHPGHSLVSYRGDEAVFKADDIANYAPDEAEALLARQAEGYDQLRNAKSMEEWTTTMAALETEAFGEIGGQFQDWIDNNILLLNQLPALQSGALPTTLAGTLDLDNIGYFGHSFGGAVASHMNMQDDRVSASYSLDGPAFTWSIAENPNGAFCFAYGNANNQAGIQSDMSWVNQQIAKATNGCELVFDGAAHMNFSDLNEISVLKFFGMLGPVDSQIMRNSLNQSLVEFFDSTLRKQGEMTQVEGTELIQHKM
jgi:predicted dienelactone hydrolase